MSVIERLACSLGRRDEIPNQELAKSIVAKNDLKAIKELIDNLHNKDKNIQSDCIKVLYEAGERKPSLIAGYIKEFLSLLENKNNRLQWGAMAALDQIAGEEPKPVYENLGVIIDAADKGSVITKDHAVNILIKLASQKKYNDEAITLLMEQLLSAPTNQLPKYAEDSIPVISDKYSKTFIKILSGRLAEIEKDTKRKRVEKVIKKLS